MSRLRLTPPAATARLGRLPDRVGTRRNRSSLTLRRRRGTEGSLVTAFLGMTALIARSLVSFADYEI
jgi:hypothetical protein